MRTKQLMIGLLVGSIFFVMIGSNALAGNVQRNRWEGVAIGVAATLLGQALLDHHNTAYGHSVQARSTVYLHQGQSDYPPTAYGRKPGKGIHHGQFQNVWVPPVHKNVWNSGHYNHRGRWIPGHWAQIQIKPGYWTKQRIVSANRPGRRVHSRR